MSRKMKRKRESSSSSSSSYVPMNLVLSIVERLPVKSVIRFMCVSKALSSYIQSSTFITNHIKQHYRFSQQHHPPSKFLYQIGEKRLTLYTEEGSLYLVRNLPYEGFHIQIVGSGNGVLCLKNYNNEEDFWLWNPLIERSLILPKPVIQMASPLLGFGYDPIANDYKLVRVICDRSQRQHQLVADVYTVSTHKWRRLEIHIVNPVFLGGGGGFWRIVGNELAVYVNEVSHWLVEHSNSEICHRFILSFDMRDESFHELALPDRSDQGVNVNHVMFPRLMSFKESICLVWGAGFVTWPLTIWAMMEYGNTASWVILRTCYVHERYRRNWQVFGFKSNGDVFLTGFHSQPTLLKQKSRKLKKLNIQNGLVYFGAYMKSLALLDVDEDDDDDDDDEEDTDEDKEVKDS